MLLTQFKLVRWLIGGRWARVSGYLWGKRWVRVPKTCLEYTEEQYSYGWPWTRAMDWFLKLLGLLDDDEEW